MSLVLPIIFGACDGKRLLDLEEIEAARNAPRLEQALQGAGGLRGEYYTFTAKTNVFETKRMTRLDAGINFNFDKGPNGGPGGAMSTVGDKFATRWTGYVVAPKTGSYVLCTCADDGIRLQFDGLPQIDRWEDTGARFWWTEKLDLEGGKRYPIKIEYFENGGNAAMRLFWAINGTGTPEQICSNTAELPNADQPYDCSMVGQTPTPLNPELSLIPAANLVPAGNEIDQYMEACKVPKDFVDESKVPDPDLANTQRAKRLFQRLAGVDVSLFDARVGKVKALLDQGKPKDAARLVTQDYRFYDKTVRAFAAKMSTRAERADAPLNDFTATVIGVTRDRIDARKLLTGDFVYRAREILFWHDRRPFSRYYTLETNMHYEQLESSGYPLACALDEMSRYAVEPPANFKQMLPVPQPNVGDAEDRTIMEENPDPAGVLTSRSWAEAHMIAGTDRRPVQKAFEQFLCAPIETWRDIEVTDAHVGRDVERFPNGGASLNEFLTGCKGCHAPMDAMRGAFAYYHFDNNMLKYGPLFLSPDNRSENVNNAAEGQSRMKLTSSIQETQPSVTNRVNDDPRIPVAWKLNHNINYPDGKFVKDDSYQNLLVEARHLNRFGWAGNTSGKGARSFGRMIANSQLFPRCMAQRVYQSVCRRDPFAEEFPPELTTWLYTVGDQFAADGYNLKDLFETLAVSCLD